MSGTVLDSGDISTKEVGKILALLWVEILVAEVRAMKNNYAGRVLGNPGLGEFPWYRGARG